MGVNRAGFGIIDDAVVREAATQEIIRRYFRYACEYAMGFVEKETVERLELLMEDLHVKPEDRRVVEPARQAAAERPGSRQGQRRLLLRRGHRIAGRRHRHRAELPPAARLVQLDPQRREAARRHPDHLHLLPPTITDSLRHLKKDVLEGKKSSLDVEETLIALSISAASNPAAEMAIEKLRDLRACEVHLTHIPTPGDEAGLRKLGVNVTSDPEFASRSLFVR